MHWTFWLAAQIRACLASGHQLRRGDNSNAAAEIAAAAVAATAVATAATAATRTCLPCMQQCGSSWPSIKQQQQQAYKIQ